MLNWRGRAHGAIGAAIVAAGLTAGLAVTSPAAFAEGSRTIYPSAATCGPNSTTGSCRANIEWRTNTYGPSAGTKIPRRTLFHLYAVAGETIAMGSTAVGVGSGDVVVWNPGVVTDDWAATLPTLISGTNGFTCSAQRAANSGQPTLGMITTRAMELAGPQAVTGGGNPSGYLPCHYSAPSTGIYSLAFWGPAGSANGADGTIISDVNLANAGDFDTGQGSSIAGWDVTVRASDSSTTDLPGRSFTYALAAFTGGNGKPVNQSAYVTTLDGYRYRVDTNGLDPNGFMFYANEVGFLDADGIGPLDHDLLGNNGTLSTVSGNADMALPTHPISFTPLSAATLAALSIPATPTAPVLPSVSFTGNAGGNSSYIGIGGSFQFTGNVPSVYEIVISRDGTNFDPGTALNRVLRGNVSAGSHTVAWDGKDNTGTDFPVGTNYAVRARLHAGEYHFPLVDAENSTNGGPSITLENPPGSVCAFGNCSTAFYDDRGYHTSGSTGSDVGTLGSALCGNVPPATLRSDPWNGFDSTTNQRAFGVDSGGNTNVSCTGSFGDTKALDLWTFYPSATTNAALNVLATPAAPTATNDAYTTPFNTPLNVSATGILGNDTGGVITVTAHTSPSHGTLTQSSDGSFTYTPTVGFTGTDSFTYTITDGGGRTATATVTIDVSGTLPTTGVDLGVLWLIALALLVVGGVLLQFSRRRFSTQG